MLRCPGAGHSRWEGSQPRGQGSAVTIVFVPSWPNKRHEDMHALICAEDPCLASLIVHVPVSLTRVCAHKVQESCLYLGRHLGMAPRGRKRLGKAAKAPVEARATAAYDFGRQERRELSGPEAVPEGTVYLTPLQTQCL